MKYALSNCLTAILVYVLASSNTIIQSTEIVHYKPKYEAAAPKEAVVPIVRSKYYISFQDSITTVIVDSITEPSTGSIDNSRFSKYFNDSSDLRSFCRYIKTQSYNDDEATWITIAVMFNRLDHYQCDWMTYYNTPKINNSRTIKRLKAGTFKKSFRLDDKLDNLLYEQVKQTLSGANPISVPSNVLYFEACNNSPNRNVHSMKNLWRKVVSKNKRVKPTRFYYEP